MSNTIKIISPVDGKVYKEFPGHNQTDIETALQKATAAREGWRQTTVQGRAKYLQKFVEAFRAAGDRIAEELSWQMGRPIKYAPSEVNGTIERAVGMIDIAAEALADIDVGQKTDLNRFIRREPLGTVLVVPAWNYPYLIAVNSIVPALMSGNAVILRHSAQTPLVAERFADAFSEADLPDGLFQFLHLDHTDTANVIRDCRVDFVAFTGSVNGGHEIQKVVQERFIGVGLELGGKDPAYVREDANLAFAVENLVDGAFFNSGQSCCGIERIYVHKSVFSRFVSDFVDLTRSYRLGNPLDPDTTLGPLAKQNGADYVKKQIVEAVQTGAKPLLDTTLFPETELGPNYLAPQVLIDVDHDMSVMMDESFGPVVGIMPVSSDEEALKRMNDSPFGLTASIWTENEDDAIQIGNNVQTGTWFMNRCDYLDPHLAWVGVKDSGRGCTLSRVGYEHLTRPKSFHLRLTT